MSATLEGSEYFISGRPRRDNVVELWSSRRLPFEPTGQLRLMRDELRLALKSLKPTNGEFIYATYVSAVKETCDVENVLYYNVGISAFSRTSRDAIRFERAFSPPPVSPTHLGFEPEHYHRYELAGRTDRLASWTLARRLARWEVHANRLPVSSVSGYWWWMDFANVDASTVPAEPHDHLAIQVSVRSAESASFIAAAIMKPVLDGVISAFHSHDGFMLDEVSARVARRLDIDPILVRDRLMREGVTVLGTRRLLHTRGSSVQWDPADDRLVAGELSIERTREVAGCVMLGELFVAKPSGADPG